MRKVQERGNELATVLISTYLRDLHWCTTHLGTKVQLFYEWAKRTVHFSLLQGNIWIWSILNLRYYEFPDSVIRPFPLLVCEGSTSALESWKVGTASRFGLNLPPAESIQPENLSPFNVCTQKCRRQRKWATDENVEDKQTAYKRALTLITHLYAVLVSIHGGTIILHRWI